MMGVWGNDKDQKKEAAVAVVRMQRKDATRALQGSRERMREKGRKGGGGGKKRRKKTDVDFLEWDPAYEACFAAVQSPLRAKRFWVIVQEGCACPPSVEIWEAMPELEKISVIGHLDFSYLEPFIEALRRGVAFQRLQELELWDITLADDEWELLLGALAGAACESQLTSMTVMCNQWPPQALATLSSMLGADKFPMLQALDSWNCETDDEIVVFLANGLHIRLL